MSHLECSSKTPGGPFIVWGWGTPRLGDGWELGRTPFQTSSVKWGLHSWPWMHAENVRVVHSTRTPCNEAWRLGCSRALLPLTPQLLMGGCEAEGTWYTFKCLLACLPHKNEQTGGSPCLRPCHPVDMSITFPFWTLDFASSTSKATMVPSPTPFFELQLIQSLGRSCFLSTNSWSCTGEFWKGGGAWG